MVVIEEINLGRVFHNIYNIRLEGSRAMTFAHGYAEGVRSAYFIAIGTLGALKGGVLKGPEGWCSHWVMLSFR